MPHVYWTCVQKSTTYSKVFWLSLYPFSESEKQVSFLEPETGLINCKIWLNHVDIVHPLLFSWFRLTREMVELCLHCLVFSYFSLFIKCVPRCLYYIYFIGVMHVTTYRDALFIVYIFIFTSVHKDFMSYKLNRCICWMTSYLPLNLVFKVFKYFIGTFRFPNRIFQNINENNWNSELFSNYERLLEIEKIPLISRNWKLESENWKLAGN